MNKKEPKTVLPEKPEPEGRETVSAPYHFSTEEKLDLSQKMAKDLQAINSLNNQLKTASAQFKAQIKEKEAQVELTTEKVTSGYEFRDTECRVKYDAKRGRKFFFPLNAAPDAPPIKESAMEASDFQLHFPEPPNTVLADALTAVEAKQSSDPIAEARAQVKADKLKAADEREAAFR